MGISIWQLLIILAIVLVLFGAKRLRNLGGDLGSAVKNFREAVKDPNAEKDEEGEDKDKDPAQLTNESKTDGAKASGSTASTASSAPAAGEQATRDQHKV